MLSFNIRLDAVNRSSSLLKELDSTWGKSSTETRKLAAHWTKCESDAKAYEEIASALAVGDKSPEDLARSIQFLNQTTPNINRNKLETKLANAVGEFEQELFQALMDEDIPKVASVALALEQCDKGEIVEDIFAQVRMWQVATFADWITEARRERLFASKTLPTTSRSNAAFEKAALASLSDMATYLKDTEPKKCAAKIKALSEALSELKESCGQSHAAKTAWDNILQVMQTQLKVDLEKILRAHPPLKWSSEFHGVDSACLEAFNLLSRAGMTAEPPQSTILFLLDRLQASMKGLDIDIYTLLGCCNTLDYILGYLDDYTPERSKASAMLRSAKDGVVKRACSELEKHGASFVKQSGRYFQVQNPVLRTELRLEVSKAWRSVSGTRNVSSSSTQVTGKADGVEPNEMNAAVALFFEGPPKESSMPQKNM